MHPGIYDPYYSSMGLSQTGDAGAEDAFVIASHRSVSHIDLLDKKEGGSCFPAVRKQTCQKTKFFKCEVRSPPSFRSKSFLDAICRHSHQQVVRRIQHFES